MSKKEFSVTIELLRWMKDHGVHLAELLSSIEELKIYDHLSNTGFTIPKRKGRIQGFSPKKKKAKNVASSANPA